MTPGQSTEARNRALALATARNSLSLQLAPEFEINVSNKGIGVPMSVRTFFRTSGNTLLAIDVFLEPVRLEHPRPWHDESVDEHDFSVRAANCLERAGIRTFKQLAGWTEEGLRVKGLSEKTIEEVKVALKERGLMLARTRRKKR